MRKIEYILVNDSVSKSPDCVSHHSNLRDLRHYLVVEAPGFSSGFKVQGLRFKGLQSETKNSEQRFALLKKLVQLRFRYPNAKILGVSEIDGRNIHPSAAMNALRREMSDLP